ncbi:2Fe-2S iron-sulfur cluster-binding protein [Pedobacter punctiformis]|uniref:FAD-binding oxidoreductase n=1 Tax=Pedobacter punctiformis TaxID=3004097 RepID=A0ABT4LBS2_9SPHI|nr:2Fe-2S iron-sulfur cluster-binding protein [Pedobacter sp. HCMS5-2]MCZ4245359.1 FAD-binding oxidoreductase [Pedobacter sp. HCMS5-2]
MYKLRIDKIINQPGENITFQLKPAETDYPKYLAGQFISLIFEGKHKEIRRSYSFNSSPDVDEPLSITVKRVENGEISRLLHHKTTVGDVLLAQAPQGMFSYLPDDLEKDVFLFAAGVGITPLFSILKTALVTEQKSLITLVYSNRSKEDTLFFDELNEWQLKYPERLKIIYVFSNSKNLLTARLNKFYIEKLLKAHLKFDRDNALFYTCGPIIYMDLCRITLLGMGYDIKQIKRETFVLPEDEQDEDDGSAEKTVDKNTYTVVLDFKGEIYQLDIPWPKRILDVALEHKIKLPYSCHAGMCSTCAATCTKGGVRMDYNEVLTDDELSKGRVLVCTGHPTENGTTIKW